MSSELEIKERILELVKEYYNAKFSNKVFFPGKTRINYAGRVFDEIELVNLVDSSLDFWLTAGKNAYLFEKKFAEYFGVTHAILVNSGSSANLLAMSSLTSKKLGDRRLQPGDEVITVAAGFPSTVSPIIQNNLVPVFVDVDLGTYDVNTEEIESAINEKTKAIFIAHTLGNPFDLDYVTQLTDNKDIWLLEDNCDAVGSRYKNKLTGTFGNLATVSFYPAHHMTMGEGGCVITNDNLLAEIVTSLRDWGRDCYCRPGKSNTCGRRFSQQHGTLPFGYDHKYVYSHLGYNLKVTDMQAAVGLAQLEKLDSFIIKRKENFNILYNGLNKFSEFLILPKATKDSDPAWFAFPITVRENLNFSRNIITSFLESKKIQTRNLFAGNLVRQPAFIDVKKKVIGNLRNTDLIMNNTFFIGVYPGLSNEKISYIVKMFDEFFENLPE